MTIHEFKSLCIADKEDVIWWTAEFLAERIEDDLIMLLYGLNGFYVELIMDDKEGNNTIIFRSFTCITKLNPYLELIHIRFPN